MDGGKRWHPLNVINTWIYTFTLDFKNYGLTHVSIVITHLYVSILF